MKLSKQEKETMELLRLLKKLEKNGYYCINNITGELIDCGCNIKDVDKYRFQKSYSHKTKYFIVTSTGAFEESREWSRSVDGARYSNIIEKINKPTKILTEFIELLKEQNNE